ncbi:MAG: tRNA (adenosine(37)-N6)-dimethylallyltransferase MiaA [Lachnospiraceae bacterium]|nr:tRNA (adenosine(37)-N6)-dimethylallyltransferase MiaA [Lachnospiraceae bacterium]
MMDNMMIIAGPTATGKSAAAVALAKRMNGEVISADSMQVYRGMDIGSAKITEEEMQGVPHHLVDIIEPEETWNVVLFQERAKKAAQDILGRGRLPIVAGGTGFYIQALLYDIAFTDAGEDTAYRQALTRYAAEHGAEALHDMLRKEDPESAEAIHPNNIKRVIRALEYRRESGTAISAHNTAQRQRQAAYRAILFVLTMDRARLYERIDARVDRMVEEGLVEEVARLRERGLTARDVSMQGIGYRQILQALDGEISMEEAVRIVKRDTRHFAKRQLTWFKREPDAVWIDIGAYKDTEAMLDHMESLARGVFAR